MGVLQQNPGNPIFSGPIVIHFDNCLRCDFVVLGGLPERDFDCISFAPPNKKRHSACRIVSILTLSISAMSSANCPPANDKTAKIRFTSDKSPFASAVAN